MISLGRARRRHGQGRLESRYVQCKGIRLVRYPSQAIDVNIIPYSAYAVISRSPFHLIHIMHTHYTTLLTPPSLRSSHISSTRHKPQHFILPSQQYKVKERKTLRVEIPSPVSPHTLYLLPERTNQSLRTHSNEKLPNPLMKEVRLLSHSDVSLSKATITIYTHTLEYLIIMYLASTIAHPCT